MRSFDPACPFFVALRPTSVGARAGSSSHGSLSQLPPRRDEGSTETARRPTIRQPLGETAALGPVAIVTATPYRTLVSPVERVGTAWGSVGPSQLPRRTDTWKPRRGDGPKGNGTPGSWGSGCVCTGR